MKAGKDSTLKNLESNKRIRMKKVIFLSTFMALLALPVDAAEVPYTPYSTVGASDSGDTDSNWRQPNRKNSYGGREQYMPRRHHSRLNRGANGVRGTKYIPAGQDPNPSPDVYGR